MDRLRRKPRNSGGFLAFIPLRFHPANTRLSGLPLMSDEGCFAPGHQPADAGQHPSHQGLLVMAGLGWRRGLSGSGPMISTAPSSKADHPWPGCLSPAGLAERTCGMILGPGASRSAETPVGPWKSSRWRSTLRAPFRPRFGVLEPTRRRGASAYALEAGRISCSGKWAREPCAPPAAGLTSDGPGMSFSAISTPITRRNSSPSSLPATTAKPGGRSIRCIFTGLLVWAGSWRIWRPPFAGCAPGAGNVRFTRKTAPGFRGGDGGLEPSRFGTGRSRPWPGDSSRPVGCCAIRGTRPNAEDWLRLRLGRTCCCASARGMAIRPLWKAIWARRRSDAWLPRPASRGWS